MATGTVRVVRPQQGVDLIVLDDGRRCSVRRDQLDGGGSNSLPPGGRVHFTLLDAESAPAVSGVYRL